MLIFQNFVAQISVTLAAYGSFISFCVLSKIYGARNGDYMNKYLTVSKALLVLNMWYDIYNKLFFIQKAWEVEHGVYKKLAEECD